MERLKAFLQQHRERVTVIGVVFAFFLFAAGGLYLQGKNESIETSPEAVVRQQVKVAAGTANAPAAKRAAGGRYYLQPSPTELLDQLSELAALNPIARSERLQQFRILWQLYFFRLDRSAEGAARMVLDVAEDGFGVVVEGEIDLSIHPLVLATAPGEKVWVGGNILAVDQAGTGTIYLAIDHFSPGETPPFAPVQKK